MYKKRRGRHLAFRPLPARIRPRSGAARRPQRVRSQRGDIAAAATAAVVSWTKSDVAVSDGYRGRRRRLWARRPLVLVWVDAETLVVVAPRDKELLEVWDTVQFAIVQRECVHSEM